MMINKTSSFLIAGAMALAASAAVASDSAHEFSANIALTTDYLFRGISQTDGNPAVQGGFDYSYIPYGFYAGVWASNVDFSGCCGDDDNIEIDYYGGFAGEFTNGLGWDVGGIYYQYPGDDGDDDYVEAYAGLGYTFDAQLEPTVGVYAYYSPDFFGETGDAIYINPTLDLSLPMGFGLGFGYGYQDVDDSGDYSHFNVSLSRDIGMFSFGVTYDDKFSEDDFCGGADVCDDTVTFTISSSF